MLKKIFKRMRLTALLKKAQKQTNFLSRVKLLKQFMLKIEL